MGISLPPTIESYEYIPNGIVDFIMNQTQFAGSNEFFDDIRFPTVEQAFVDDIFYGEDMYVERQHTRRSGGTTLLFLIACYYTVLGKSVAVLALNRNECDNFVRLIEEVVVNTHKHGRFDNHTIMVRNLITKEERRIKMLVGNDSGMARKAVSYDVIIADPILPYPEDLLNEIKCHIRPDGTFIMNKPM